MKKKSNILTYILLIVGLAFIAYPTIGNIYNYFHQTRLIATYEDKVKDMSKEKKKQMFDEAVRYNKKLQKHNLRLRLRPEELKEYKKVLDVTGTGIMSYVEVPSENIKLAIYHGTSEGVLQVGAGHIAGTSLPTGGKGNHCVISAHTGLPSAKLFTDIQNLKKGDKFQITTIDKELVYEVEKIQTILPKQIDRLQRKPGKDLCTLMTCTPYGINSHRLLVTGHRIYGFDISDIPVKLFPTGYIIMIVLAILSAILIRRKRKCVKNTQNT